MLNHFRGTFEGTSSETEIRKSIFFCHLKMTQTVGEADQFIKNMNWNRRSPDIRSLKAA